MIVAVAGGKGGVGKTLVSTSLARAVAPVRFGDCDVEEPNAHIFLKFTPRRSDRVDIKIPIWRKWKGEVCQAGAEFCRYGALAVVNDEMLVFPSLCTACGGCFAALETRLAARPPITVDCDVDAPNLHLLLGGRVVEEETFSGPKLAFIDRSKVAAPAECDRSCPFGAITGCEVDPLKCVGCGVCALVRGPGAVTMTDRAAATIFERQTPYGRFFHARLRPGQPGFGGLVTALRMKGEQIALNDPGSLLLLDGSPGLGCRVIASLSGCDLALVVTEPGLGALADLERVSRLLAFFRMKTMIVINRYDLDRSLARDVERFSADNGLPVAGKIPCHDIFRRAIIEQKPAAELAADDMQRTLEGLYHRVREALYE